MISDQIIQDYLEEERNQSGKLKQIKIAALIVSLAMLILFSI
ncbi:hypothetical protein [Gracilimonas tropica]|nr:hypothetical protein [Gracilimonas tropica]